LDFAADRSAVKSYGAEGAVVGFHCGPFRSEVLRGGGGWLLDFTADRFAVKSYGRNGG